MNIIYNLYNYFNSNDKTNTNTNTNTNDDYTNKKYKSYIRSIGELNKDVNWFGVAEDKLEMSSQSCKDWLLDVIYNYGDKKSHEFPPLNRTYIIEFYYFFNNEELTGKKKLTLKEIKSDKFQFLFNLYPERLIKDAIMTDSQEEYDVTDVVNSHLIVNNHIKVSEIIGEDAGGYLFDDDEFMLLINENDKSYTYNPDDLLIPPIYK